MKISLDVRIGGSTRPMRFEPGISVEAMLHAIMAANALPARDDYALYVPPTEVGPGHWLPRGDSIERWQSEARAGLELRRTPHTLAVHLSADGDMSADVVTNNTTYTKRVLVDLSGSVLDALREWRVLFAPLTKQRHKEEFTVRLWRSPALSSGVPAPSAGGSKAASPADDKPDGLTLNQSFWEQGVMPSDVVVLFPVSCLKSVTVKAALSAALFSGWLLKSSIKNASGVTLRKTSTLRQSSKKPYFFVLRGNCLFSFKTDHRTDRMHKVILLDHYRFSKVSMEGKGFALRLDHKAAGFAPMASVFLLHTQLESDIDGWVKTIAMVQRPPSLVFGVSLQRLVNRASNMHQYCPDYLALVVDELTHRIVADRDRSRCLVVAGVKPPPELYKTVSCEKLPTLFSHADTACAASLRAFLVALPEPLIKSDLLTALQRAHDADDVSMAAAALSSVADSVVRVSLLCVLDLLALVPADQLPPVCDVFGPALCGSAASDAAARDALAWLLLNFGDIGVGGARVVAPPSQRQLRVSSDVPESPRDTSSAVPSALGASGRADVPPLRRLPPTQAPEGAATVAQRFEARSATELTVEVGEAVCVLQVLPGGWTRVVRPADEATGLVPSSCVVPAGQCAASTSPRTLSPRSRGLTLADGLLSPNAEERVFHRYGVFEHMAVAAIAEERRAKAELERMLRLLEQ